SFSSAAARAPSSSTKPAARPDSLLSRIRLTSWRSPPRRSTENSRLSFDHLVGAGEQGRRNGEPDRPSSLEIDHQLEFDRLKDRQVGRMLALEHPAGVDPGLPIGIEQVGSVAHQTAGIDVRPPWVNSRDRVTCRQHDEHGWLAREERIGANEERTGSLSEKGGKSRFDFLFSAGAQNKNLLVDGACSLLYLS